jgi:hypothetical protein
MIIEIAIIIIIIIVIVTEFLKYVIMQYFTENDIYYDDEYLYNQESFREEDLFKYNINNDYSLRYWGKLC